MDDHPVLLRPHERQGDRDAIQRANQVALDQRVDAVGRQRIPVPVDDVDAGIVDQNVQPVEFFPNIVTHLGDLVLVGQVGGNHMRATLRNPLRNTVQLGRGAAGQDHGGALLGEGQRRGLPDAAAGAGHPGDFSR